MRLAQRLGMAWLASALLVMALTLAGLIASVHSLALQQQERRVAIIADQITDQLLRSETPSQTWHELPQWLAVATQMTPIKALEVRYRNRIILQWGEIKKWPQLKQWRVRQAVHNSIVEVRAGYANPWFSAPWSWQTLLGASVSLLLIGGTSLWSSRWVFRRLNLVDNISRRAQRLLKGEVIYSGELKERPKVIGQAMDHLLHELEDARQERSRFDAYMRTNTFLDPVTTLGNRLFFDNQLDSAVRQQHSGFVLMLEFQGYDELCQSEHCEECFNVLSHIAGCLKQVFGHHSEPCLSRRSDGDFAVLLVAVPQTELEREIKLLLKLLQQLNLPKHIDVEHCFHIGVAAIQDRVEPYQVLAEADMALRAAQVQEVNTWFMYQRDDLPQTSIKGSVRWRSLLEEALRRKSFVLSSQPVVTTANKSVHHYEMLLRLRDEGDQLLPAHVFLPMARKCGMSGQIDRMALNQVLKLMRYDGANLVRCSINLSIDSLLEQARDPWLTRCLAQYQDVTKKLIIEVAEYPLHQHLDEVRDVLAQIRGAGCLLAVDQVGQNVVSSQYIRELSIDFLKLHASLVRSIDERSENQLFIRSLVGACENTKSRIFALAVEQQREWRTLKSLGVYGGQGHLFTETTQDTPAFLR